LSSQTTPKIFVAGHNGMVGSAIVRELKRTGDHQLIVRNREVLDLCNQVAVADFFQRERPDQVYVAAAKVGGIHANNAYPAEFIYQNLMMEVNIIHQAFLSGVKKLLFLGSSCIYPKEVQQPMVEEALLTGKLEPTNEPYAIAKIAGIKLCESYNRQYGNSHGIDYRSVMPSNLYGPGDNYLSENSHVIPALISRFHDAKIKELLEVTVWGTGKPKREFLFVDDMATAAIFVMELNSKQYQESTAKEISYLNVGFGSDVSILELSEIIKKVVGFRGRIIFDSSKPDGTTQKLLDSSRIKNLGWKPTVDLKKGIKISYENFLKNQKIN
jgi:GDP-L-fucose synthase